MNESMDRSIADWLHEGPEFGPREGLERALAATRRTSQRPGWTILERWLPMHMTAQRAPSMRPLALVAVIGLLVLGLAAAALFIGSRTPARTQFGPARNGALVFQRDGRLLIADQLGGVERPLVTGPTRDTRPVFSTQGDRIAFLRDEPSGNAVRLLTVRPDGSDLRELAGPFDQVDTLGWSTDGSTIVVGQTRGQTPTISVVRADASGVRDLDVGMPADLAVARPGGSQIAFRGTPSDGTGAGVFIVGADGTGLRRLVLPSDTTADFAYEGLAWSPDGSRLVYADHHTTGAALGWRTSVADIDPAGLVTSVRELPLPPGSTAEFVPSWSPDGKQLSLLLERDGTRQIAIAAADGTGQVTPIGPALSTGTGGFGHEWSPDGRHVLITVLPIADEQTFWSVDVASGAQQQLTGLSDDLPTWQRIVE